MLRFFVVVCDRISFAKVRNGLENALYFNNNYKANQKLTLDYGLRVSAYSLMGGDVYNVYKDDIITESILLKKNESVGQWV